MSVNKAFNKEVSMSHPNAPLTVRGRQLLCERIAHGRPVSHVAAEMGISRATAYKWWHLFEAVGLEGLKDLSSRLHSSPRMTPERMVKRIMRMRRAKKLGPFRIGAQLGVPTSTVHKVLVREQINFLSWMDRPTGTVIRRYEHKRPLRSHPYRREEAGAYTQWRRTSDPWSRGARLKEAWV